MIITKLDDSPVSLYAPLALWERVRRSAEQDRRNVEQGPRLRGCDRGADQAIGKQGLVGDPQFAGPQERAKNIAAVDTLLSAWCQERTKIEVMDILQGAGVPAGAVLNTQEHCEDPHLRKCGMFVTVEHPVRGAVIMPGWPVKLSESHVPVRCAPLLGAHTEEVLSEWLGLSKQEIQEFRKATPVET